MLVFVDESEWPRPLAPGGYTVWAGIGVCASNQREFFREIFNLEKKFWKAEEPYDFEIKGRLLLNKKALSSPKKREFVEEILSLCKLNKAVAFAVGLRYPMTAAMEGLQPNTFQVVMALCERVERMMEEQYPGGIAVIVFDSQDNKKDKTRALEFGNYVYGTATGRGMTHVVSTPLFTSSDVTKGVQIADLFAYALAQQNMGRTDLTPFCDRIRELEWWSTERLDNRPWRGFYFRDMNVVETEREADDVKQQRIGDSSQLPK